MPPKNVKVVVLGDLGRSPRMQYHCLSLAEKGHYIDFIGYGDTAPVDEIKLKPNILYHYMAPVPVIPLKLLNYIVKTVWQTLNLLFLLFITSKSDYLLVQNPPAVPTLAVCWLYAKIVGATLVIDWHNYAHSIMALSVGAKHPLVVLTKWLEMWAGRRAINFCVTKAMREDLRRNHGITATTLYDRPPEIFQPISVEKRQEFLKDFATLDWGSKMAELTKSGKRSGLLISSTSWTEDEDFKTLLWALEGYERHIEDGNVQKLPKLICIITGRGPMKDHYMKLIKDLDFRHIAVITPWLESSDYPKLLACADLGVCLHTSSSGLDLPMKVVDMFGCGLPVCAQNYNCINELVRHGRNSFVFEDHKELFNLLADWFEDFGENDKQKELLRQFKAQLEDFQNLRWKENWNLVAARIFS